MNPTRYFASIVSATASALIVSMLPATTEAGQVGCRLEFDLPRIENVGSYQRVLLPEGYPSGTPGAPAMPAIGIWLALPPGETAVTIELRGESWRRLPGNFLIEPISRPRRLSDTSPYQPTPPDPEIYQAAKSYPYQPVDALRSHYKRGFALATCLVWPVRWNPASGELEYLTQAELYVTTTPDAGAQSGFDRFYRGEVAVRNWAKDQVRNPELLAHYPRRDPETPEAMLIVTDPALLEPAGDYATWRRSRGMQTYVVTAPDLVAAYPGVDDPEKIRNGIIAAFEEWGFDHLLLLGDDEQIPHRGCWGEVGETTDYDIPTDLYFAAFDGNWNNDRDDKWGETEEADLLAEVTVGRIPAGDTDEATRALDKVILYSEEPVADDVLKVLMVGEYLGWQKTGGDYMDEVYDECRLYSYHTVGYPDRFDEQRYNLYDEDFGPDGWDGRNDLAPLISEGYHFINHLGHANTVYDMKLDDISDELITNDGFTHELNIAYSQGCYAGAFDNRGDDGQLWGDCIGEKFIWGLTGGFAAFICNSRYGWGSGGNTDGPSQRFHREYVDAIFNDGKTLIGLANQESKEVVIPYADETVLRWCYYETNLLGDPAMDLWTDIPGELDVEYPPALEFGESTCEVAIPDLEGATICISSGGVILGAGTTDVNGAVRLTFDEPLHESASMRIIAVAHNYVPFSARIQVAAPEEGFPWVESVEIVDTAGNGNGSWDYGEPVDLLPLVHNLGLNELSGLDLFVASDDEYVTVVTSQTTYPVIAASATKRPVEPLSFMLSPQCPDLHPVSLNLTLRTADRNEWQQTTTVFTHAPIISDWVISVKDTAIDDNQEFQQIDGDQWLDPGEEALVSFTLVNSGSGSLDNLSAELATECPFIMIGLGVNCPVVTSNAPTTLEPFAMFVDSEMPNPSRAVFYLRLTGDRGFKRSFLIDQGIGGQFYNFDRGEAMLDHSAIVGGADQWHKSDNDNFGPQGSSCLKVGSDQPNGKYAGFLNCVAYLPEFQPTGDFQLIFRHKMDAECRPDTNLAFDGGFVEITADGENWDTVLPARDRGRGYPNEIQRGRDRNLLPDGQPCYSGDFDWEPALFDLLDYGGQTVQLRFHFASDSSMNRKGWLIDDIELRLPTDLESPDDLAGELQGRGARLIWSTPNLNRDAVEPNILLGYRIYREAMLDTLVTDNQYFDDLVGQTRGSYDYLVTAEYTTGESPPSNLITLFWAASAPTETTPLPAELELTSVYPNPFNHAVKIAYSVPLAGDLTLSVYDLRGRRVSQLFSGYRAQGSYQTLLQADELASGIYVLRLETASRSLSSKMVLIR